LRESPGAVGGRRWRVRAGIAAAPEGDQGRCNDQRDNQRAECSRPGAPVTPLNARVSRVLRDHVSSFLFFLDSLGVFS
jgi:hypothetical protein